MAFIMTLGATPVHMLAIDYVNPGSCDVEDSFYYEDSESYDPGDDYYYDEDSESYDPEGDYYHDEDSESCDMEDDSCESEAYGYVSIEAVSAVEWQGEGTASNPYLIGTAEELMLLAYKVNNSPAMSNNSVTGTFYDVHFRITADIELDHDWEPIGRAVLTTVWVNPNERANGREFDGTFDGGGYTITFAHGSRPLFGAVWRNTEIRNVNIYSPYINGHGLIEGVNAQIPPGDNTYPLIDNVRILSGTTVRGSGFAGTDGFRPQNLDIRNSTIEAGVRIGFDADANAPFDQNTVYFAHTAGTGPGVGSFVSGLSGRITNSSSYATVYGHYNVRNVGGLVGYKQQSMRSFRIENSHFHGEIIAPYSMFVGGILGAGYDSPSTRNNTSTGQLGSFVAAPNTPGAHIHNSTVTGSIIGYDFVGGIVGGEFANQMWATGWTSAPQHTVIGNHFEGALIATAQNARNVGGIFGYIRSLNRNNVILNNTFAYSSGAERGIGHVSIIDTNYVSPMAILDTTYFNSQGSAPGSVEGFAGIIRANHYRTDDPLGIDKNNLVKMIGGRIPESSVDRTALNNAISSAEAYMQVNYTTSSWNTMQEALDTARQVSNNKNATQAEINIVTIELNNALSNLVQVTITDPIEPDEPEVGLQRARIRLEVYNPNARAGDPRLFLENGTARFMYIYIAPNETAYTILRRAETGLNIHSNGHSIWSGMYVESINNWGEFDGGPLSGWMYSVNGVFPDFSASLFDLRDGDRVSWLYTYNLGNDIGGSFDEEESDEESDEDDYDIDSDSNISSENAKILKDATVETEFGVNSIRERQGVSPLFVSEWVNPFADVEYTSWYFDSIRFVYSNNIMIGTADGQFSPNLNLSRAMMVTMLWRLEGSPIGAKKGIFRDVDSDGWYSDAIAWANENGIVNGFGNGMFGPNDNMTREQLAVILQNYARFNGIDAYGGNLAVEFADENDISEWARDAFEWANLEGLITGRTMNTLAPDGTATRAEAAEIMQRFILGGN